LLVLLILLLVFVSILIKSPKYEEGSNEKRKLGFRLWISCLLVQLAQIIGKEIMVYDLLFCFVNSI